MSSQACRRRENSEAVAILRPMEPLSNSMLPQEIGDGENQIIMEKVSTKALTLQ